MFKSTLVFFSNKLTFMFMRHTFREHLILLMKTLAFSILCSALLAASLITNLISLETELWPALAWTIDLLESFISIQKLIYIGITYIAALFVNLLAEEMVSFQTRRTQTTNEFLIDELRANTRAVIITMSNALSFIFKIFIGISLILATLIYFGSYENGKSIELNAVDILYQGAIFLVFDCGLFIIQRFLLSFNEKDQNALTNQASGTA